VRQPGPAAALSDPENAPPPAAGIVSADADCRAIATITDGAGGVLHDGRDVVHGVQAASSTAA